MSFYGSRKWYKGMSKGDKQIMGKRYAKNRWVRNSPNRYYGRYRWGMKAETKFFDVTTTYAAVASTGEITDSVCKIPQGVTEKTRVGRKCTIVSIDWRNTVDLAATTDLTDATLLRIIVYVDKQCNGATAVTLDILETDAINSHYNLSNKNRFRFLTDKTINLNFTAAGGNGTANDAVKHIRQMRFRKRCSIPIEFSSTTGAITEIKSNNIGLLLIASENNTCGANGILRLRFRDG